MCSFQGPSWFSYLEPQTFKNKVMQPVLWTQTLKHSFILSIFCTLFKVALEQFCKLGSALARHTGQEEGERVAILLHRGLANMLLNQIPGHPPAEIDGQE